MSDGLVDNDDGKPPSGRVGEQHVNRINIIAPAALLILALLIFLIWLVLPIAHIVTTPSAGADDFEAALDLAMARNAGNFDLWYKSNMAIQSTLILSALLATVFASITTKANAEQVKKWSVLLTAVTAALASIQSTFHVRENIETFIRSTGDLVLLETDYLVERAPLDSTLKKSTGQDLDPDTSKKLIELRQKYMPRFVDIESARMRAWASAGQQSAGSQSSSAAEKKR